MAGNWHRSFPETNMRMLDEDILCDVTFLVGESRHTMAALKFILVSRSLVFHAMFCGPLAETSDAIQIPDIDVDTFRTLLRYMYTADCAITPDTVMSLLYAAKKYDVTGLYSNCKKYLEKNITPENVCTILQQTNTFDEKPLVDRCVDFINKNGKECFESEGFLSLSQDMLKLVLQSDYLSVEEEDTYTACVKWSEETCKRLPQDITDANCRSALGDALKFIRFPLMSLETVTSLVSDREILTSQEKLSLYQYMAYRKRKPNCSIFSAEYRSTKKRVTFYRLSERAGYGWSHDSKTDALSFLCSKDCLLGGVGLYAPSVQGNIHGNLQLSEGVTVLASEDIDIAYEEGVTCIDIKFPCRIEIKKDTIYTLAQTCKGTYTYYGSNGHNTLEQDGLQVKFYESEKSTNSTSMCEGQFRHLHFYI